MAEGHIMLDNVYRNREPNALEKSLAERKKPGYIPPGWETYVLPGVMRALKITDPAKYARIKAAQINGEDIDIPAILRGEVQ